ncbi:MAG TPA: presqualene diphosphate synthase HpnD [Nocardioides sp.]|uniref:presqualene diphosphate synthase HpnD n=1 Tax=Nocardioides sp. TaxID=35761 RepID=UPI002E3359DA|nr:presqualene diphosphate synthase HpnD [Nocardioides sp.]HEX3930870.1 presqualene diphosphate synthase HpnD [Nocardioides sp.]
MSLSRSSFVPHGTLGEAYQTCADITRTEARNFFYGIRLLPPGKRDALCALYALARRIDDIGDGDLPLAEKREALAAVRKALGSLDESTHPVYVAVADAARRYPVPIEAFEEIVDGVELDLGDVRIADFDELVRYCRLVAGSVGRLCLSVFGSGGRPDSVETLAPRYADQLGVALQQTNILRDIREDLLNGRVYLPADELERHGVELRLDDAGALDDRQGRLAGYIRYAATRAEDWYGLGMRLVPHLDRRSAASCLAMAGIYHHLLQRIEADPVAVYDRRLSLGGLEKARVAMGSLAAGSRGRVRR